MPDRNGSAYGLTAIFPIKNGRFTSSDGYETSYLENLQSYLAGMPQAGGGPFARAPITHFSRFVVIDRLGYNGEPSKAEDLRSAYLLWTCCFNGDLLTYLGGLYATMHQELSEIFEHCVAFEDYPGEEGFTRYVKYCQVTTSFLFADYPDATVEDVLISLQLRKNFMPFARQNQDTDAATLRANFEKWVREVEDADPPVPGAVL